MRIPPPTTIAIRPMTSIASFASCCSNWIGLLKELAKYRERAAKPAPSEVLSTRELVDCQLSKAVGLFGFLSDLVHLPTTFDKHLRQPGLLTTVKHLSRISCSADLLPEVFSNL